MAFSPNESPQLLLPAFLWASSSITVGLVKPPTRAYNTAVSRRGGPQDDGFRTIFVKEATMKLRTIFAGVCLSLLSIVASAQTKISGSAQCTKPDIQQKVDIPDHPGHSLSISQFKCTWTKPLEVAGVQSKDGVDSGAGDIHGDKGTSHGYYVDAMANGDKAFVHWQGTDSMKDGTSEGKWTYTGGTGKFKGLKGGGTYKGKTAQDGTISFDVEGEYTLPKQ